MEAISILNIRDTLHCLTKDGAALAPTVTDRQESSYSIL
jgi:hypothetical protein